MSDVDVAGIAADLRAEQDALEAVVADLPASAWDTPTPSPGWAVRDQIGHLTYFDDTAVLAITDPEAFKASVSALFEAAGNGTYDDLTLYRSLSASELLEEWRRNRARLAEAARGLNEGDRIPWYGPSMSAKSFLTARLMETWAHGQDVVDAVDGSRPATSRLRHIAQLGFITRGWSYKNRGLEVPEAPVRVALQSPGGETWTWGPDDAADVVSGPAEDFCMVVTQRRHVDDTALSVVGEAARDWMLIAQAFAGGASDGPARRSQP
jgi:uncharacterized protein (TIGR03084 family)